MPVRKPHDPNAKTKKPDPLDGLPQAERFRIVAEELGCDDDEAAFRAKLGQIARYRPEPKKMPKA
jgi:hypothetical protein